MFGLSDDIAWATDRGTAAESAEAENIASKKMETKGRRKWFPWIEF